MSLRNILYVGSTSKPLGEVAGSGFTHIILGNCRIRQNPAKAVFRILNTPISSITPLFRSADYAGWIPSLDAGTFPESLRRASAEGFVLGGIGFLSDDLTVTVLTSGSSWTLTDNVSGESFAMQVDLSGTFVSFNGSSLCSITDYAAYETSLNAGKFTSDLQQALNLPGDNADYTVTQLPAQSDPVTGGLPQWLITYTPNGFVWYVGIGSQTNGQTNVMVLHEYQDLFTPNVRAFVASLDSVVSAHIPILLSLGGAGDDLTWQVMSADPTQCEIVVAEIFASWFGQNGGIDFDWEAGTPAANVPAMVQFAQDLQAALPGVICTICPYDGTQSTMIQVWAGLGLNGLSWANFQNYAGSANFGSSVLDDFLSAVTTALGLASNSDAAPYVVPGFNAGGCTLDDFTALLAADVSAYRNIAGAFTWNLDNMGLSSTVTLADWASAVAAALSPTSA